MKFTTIVSSLAFIALNPVLAQDYFEDDELVAREAFIGRLAWNPVFGQVGAGLNPGVKKQNKDEKKADKSDKDDKDHKDDDKKKSDDSDKEEKKSKKKEEKKEKDKGDDDSDSSSDSGSDEGSLDSREILEQILYERDLFDFDDEFDFDY